MIIPDTKRAAGIIMGKIGSMGTSEVKPEEEVDPKVEGLRAAAEDILHAIETKSSHDLMQALQAFLSQADSDEGPEESDEV